MRQGRVTSTTLMANRPGLTDQVKMLRDIDRIGVGIHLVLSSGQPVRGAAEVPSLVDETGSFPRDYRRALYHARLAEVEAEWRAQIEKALLLGLGITHLDSHHHVHLHSMFTGLAVRLAQEYGIGAVRSASPLDPELPNHQFTAIISSREAGESRHIISQSGLKTVDRLMTGVMSLASLPRDFDGVAELCCHPGQSNATLVAISSLNVAREEELAYLLGDEFADILRERNFTLTHYGEL
jgi:predicted glycoside hydrolase/deacetylase ChbG (UPF0249 family)